MIAKLRGTVDSLDEDFAVIDVNGVGYLVFCSGRTLGRLDCQEAAELLIETHVREDHIHLYGFLEAAERDWFKLLTTVQGVGARVGLAILTALSIDELVQAVAAQDGKKIIRAQGVGPKLAGRIVRELKDKAGGLALGSAASDFAAAASAWAPVGGPTADAVSALVNLGYGRSEALGAVSRTAARLGEDAGLQALIRGSLAELAPVEHAP